MLTANEAATIRAALRFWMDEVIPAGQETASHYFDDGSTELISHERTKDLARKFDLSSIRYIEPDSVNVGLRNHDEVALSPGKQFHTVIVARKAT